MRELLPELLAWRDLGEPAALATVLRTWGSSPRPAGAHMVIRQNGEFAGSVSGGCVETAVIETAFEVIRTGSAQKLKFGVADESAWEVGLACGGEIEIVVSPIDWQSLSPILEKIRLDRPVWYQVSLDTAGEITITDPLPTETTAPRLDDSSQPERFVLFAPPQPQLVIVGGVNIAQELVPFAKLMGYRTVIIDPRKAFASPQRFPQVDQIIQAWPEEAFEQLPVTAATAIAVLTHDDKIDIPALREAVSSPAFYIGALGSPTTFARRVAALREEDVPELAIQRIHGPIGLDIGARSPREIALSIIAEITAEKAQSNRK